MDGTNPQISFIPKGSLVREESFLERSRPRSVMGFVAITVFVLVFGAFGGLYFYNNSLNQIIAQKTIEIKKAQKEFSDTPEVGDAKLFRARADLARELLNGHLVASPIFEFLSNNTVSNIAFSKFDFKNAEGVSSLDLTGEAPSYASLAYQVDLLQKRTKELSGLYVEDITLTSFGTVTFSMKMVFNPDFLLYTKNLAGLDTIIPTANAQTVSTPIVGTPGVNFGTPTETGGSTIVAPEVTPAATTTSVTPSSSTTTAAATPVVTPAPNPEPSTAKTNTSAVSAPAQQTFLQALWQKFKFW